MKILDDLQILLSKTQRVPYDPKSKETQLIEAELSKFSWRFLTQEEKPKPEWYGLTDYSGYFVAGEQGYAARIYELMWFSRIAYAAQFGIAQLEFLTGILEEESLSSQIPTRSNLILRGCLEYRKGNFGLAKHYISRGHHELIPDSIVSPFFA